MDSNFEDDLNYPSSWIPIKTIKKLMGIKQDQKSQSKPMPNSNSVNSNFHKKNTDSKPPKAPSKILTNPPQDYIKFLETRLTASEAEKNSLKSQIHKSEVKNLNLRSELTKLKQNHTIKVQEMQEKHERKLLRTKNDLDYFLKEMNNQSTLIILEDFTKIHLAEMEKCREEYEIVFNEFIKKYKKGQVVGDDVQNEIQRLRSRYEQSVEEVKMHLVGSCQEDSDEDNISTGLNSERVTSEMNLNSFENTAKMHIAL